MCKTTDNPGLLWGSIVASTRRLGNLWMVYNVMYCTYSKPPFAKQPPLYSCGIIQIRINDPRSLRSWCIKETNESLSRVDSAVPLMYYPRDLGSLILIWVIPKECTHLYDTEDFLYFSQITTCETPHNWPPLLGNNFTWYFGWTFTRGSAVSYIN